MFLIRSCAAGLLLAFVAAPVSAVQLGPLEVRTDFGEPLEASIEVADTARLRPRNLSVSFYDYRMTGRALPPERVLVLSRLRYEVTQPARGENLRIRLYTEEPLEEARFGFRLEVRTNRGTRHSRRYLHILPGTLIAGSDGAFRDRRRDRRTLAERRDRGWQLGMAAPERDLYVSSNDYDALWIMAQQLKSGYGLTAFQAMLAIFDINRHAFGQDGTGRKNINLLWAGKELKMPSLDEMRSYDRYSAIVEVAKQNYHSGMELPIETSAIRDLLVIRPPPVSPDEVLEPWQPSPDERPRPTTVPPLSPDDPDFDIGVEPEEVTPEELPPAPEEEPNLLLYLLGGAIVVLLLAIVVLLMRRGGDGPPPPPPTRPAGPAPAPAAETPAPSTSRSPTRPGSSADVSRIDNQLALLRAHVDMGDKNAAGVLYGQIAQNPEASPEQVSAARELLQRLGTPPPDGS